MYVQKRNGSLEDVNLDKIINSIKRSCDGLDDIDVYSISVKTVGGLYDGVPTKELDILSIQTAVSFMAEDPIYSKAAARLLAGYIDKEVTSLDIHSFSQSIRMGNSVGLISDETYDFVMDNKRKLNNAIIHERNRLFEYYGLRIVYDRYLLKEPNARTVIESPQYFFMRVACGLANNVKEAIDFYKLISSMDYMASTPTLFNSGTMHSQMSSCYLLDSPMDDLRDIEKRKSDVALLSKWAGGIGLSYSKIRSNGELIKGTNGISNGIVTFLHSLDANVAAVNQCLSETTPVITDRGWIMMKDISTGDKVLTTSGFRSVNEIMKESYSGDMISLTIDGNKIQVTPEHPFLVIKNNQHVRKEYMIQKFKSGTVQPEWVEARNINKDDIILRKKHE